MLFLLLLVVICTFQVSHSSVSMAPTLLQLSSKCVLGLCNVHSDLPGSMVPSSFLLPLNPAKCISQCVLSLGHHGVTTLSMLYVFTVNAMRCFAREWK